VPVCPCAHCALAGNSQSGTGNLAACLACLDPGSQIEAEALERQILASHTQAYGAEHPSCRSSTRNLAGCLARQGKHAEAAQLLSGVLELEMRLNGSDDPTTLSTAHYLALALSGSGKRVEAEAMLRRTLEAQTRVLGPDHADTRYTAEDLVRMLM
jgi:hypothetical protein